jgi:hypothetical protein
MSPGETLWLPSSFISPRRVNDLFALAPCSYLLRHTGNSVRRRRTVFPQRLPPACRGRKVFVASMLVMAAAAVYLATLSHETPNIIAGTLAFYLITTAWITARRKDGLRNNLDWGMLLIPLVGGSWVFFGGLQKLFSSTPPIDGVPMGMNFFVGSVMVLAAAGDIRMMLGGVSGTKRLVRHLWRMCFGLFIATGSFFLGQQQVFPAVLRGSVLLVVLAILPLILLIFWLFRVRFTNAYKGKSTHLASPSPD